MTICIAAICKEGVIFGAADRMLTSGDIQFEPPTPKICQITSSITIMLAGDTAFQTEIFQELSNTVFKRIKENQDNWLKVKDITECYVNLLSLYKQKRAENSILTPLDLDKNTFITRQHEMSQEFVMSLTEKILSYALPPFAAIITGVDDEGPHIYVVNGDQVSCMDTIGFASIGIGSRHAQSQFMLARYSRNSQLSETLLLTYFAKKRSEVSPGVGKETDIFMQGPTLGSFITLNPEILNRLDKIFNQTTKKEFEILQKAKKEIFEFITKIQEETVANESQTVTNTDDDSLPK